MLQGIITVCVALFCVAAANSCPGLPKMQNFNATGFLGSWYELANFDSARDNRKGYPTCRALNLATGENGGYTAEEKEYIVYTNFNGVRRQTERSRGSVVFNVNDPEVETVSMKLKRSNNDFGGYYNYDYYVTVSFFVIDTDYTSYAIIATCNYGADSITILSRTKSLPNTTETATVNNKLNDSLDKYGLNQCDFQFVSNECSASY